MSAKRNSKNSYLFWLILVIAIIVGIVVFFLSYSNSSSTTTSVANAESSFVSCSRDHQDPENVISTSNPTSVSEEVRATFLDDQLTNVTRTYSGTYASHDAAVSAEAEIHAAYNIYVGSNNGVFAEPSYNIVDNTMKMVLFADSANYKNSMTRDLFLFDPKMNSNNLVSSKSLMTDLEVEGFTCNLTISSKEDE